MIASSSPTWFRVLLGAFGIAQLVIMTGGLLRDRRNPPDANSQSFRILMVSYGLIGVTALGAAALGSRTLFGVMAALTLAHVIFRRMLTRRHSS